MGSHVLFRGNLADKHMALACAKSLGPRHAEVDCAVGVHVFLCVCAGVCGLENTLTGSGRGGSKEEPSKGLFFKVKSLSKNPSA